MCLVGADSFFQQWTLVLKGIVVQRNKQEITKVVPLCILVLNMGVNLFTIKALNFL